MRYHLTYIGWIFSITIAKSVFFSLIMSANSKIIGGAAAGVVTTGTGVCTVTVPAPTVYRFETFANLAKVVRLTTHVKFTAALSGAGAYGVNITIPANLIPAWAMPQAPPASGKISTSSAIVSGIQNTGFSQVLMERNSSGDIFISMVGTASALIAATAQNWVFTLVYNAA